MTRPANTSPNQQTRRRRGKGEGAVYRRSEDGRWVAVLDLGYVDGKRHRKTVYGKTKQEALRNRKALERALESGQDLTRRSTTVATYLIEWLAGKEVDGTRATTLTRYRSMINLHIVPAFGRIRIDQLRPAEIERFLTKKLSDGLAAATVRQIRALLNVAFHDAERLRLIATNPVRLTRAPKPNPKTFAPLSPEEGRHLLEQLVDDRLFALYAVLLGLGLRRGEALGLKWADIDIDTRTLRVQRSLQRINGSLQETPPKSASSRRNLPLSEGLVAVLRQHQVRQHEERLALGPCWPQTDYVFTSTTGTPIEPRNVNRQWDQHRDALGRPDLRLHDLRHAAATLLLAAGTHPRVLMDILGHSQFSTTMNTYAHVMPPAKEQAAVAIDQALFA
jgi:integrase